MFQRLDKDVLLTIATRLVIVVAGIITSVVTARILGLEGRGEYFYAVTLAGFVTQFANFGFPSANVYFIAGNHDLLGSLMANSIWLSLATLVISSMAILLGIGSILHQENGILLAAACLGSINLLFLLLSNLLIGVQRTRQYNLIQLLSNGLTLVFVLLAGMINGTPEHFLISSVTALVIANIISIKTLLPKARRWHFDRALFMKSASYSLRAFSVTMIGFAMLRGNVMFLKHFSGTTDLGYFSIATQITDAINVLPASIALVIFPRLVRGKKADRFTSMILQAKTVAVVMLLACIAGGLVSPLFIKLAFGEKFLPATSLLFLLLPGTFFLALATIVSQYLAAEGIPRINIYAWIFNALFTLGLCWYLVPLHKATGAAIAFSIGHTSLFISLLLSARGHARHQTTRNT